MTPTAFSQNLKRIRILRGHSMEALADLLGCSKQAISHYENDSRFPDGGMLTDIARVLCVDIQALINPVSVDLNLLEVNYRLGSSLDKNQKSDIEQIAAQALAKYLEAEQLAKEPIKFENPVSDLIINDTSDAEKAAKSLRKRWKLGDAPITSVTRLLENKGVRVLKIDFGANFNHEGLSGWAEENTIPVIVVNARQTELTRMRFTLLHELAHLILMVNKKLDYETIEKICESFAGAMLIPTEVLKSEFGKNRSKILFSELRKIKEYYGISILAIMVRARFAGLINHNAYMEWVSTKSTGNDHGQYNGHEEPERLDQLLLKSIGEGRIGLQKAASLSGRSQESFEEIYDTHFFLDI
jgi:Zn-dependent peptidase ImmA (M78 family)/DNA-binding XRE family transcriptional regulator